MKNYNKILEAVNRGIKFALDDFEDDQVQNIKSKQVQNRDYTKEYLDLMQDVVDLGLPSGTLWCKYNLGVDPNQLSKPEDWYGKYYAWGELIGNKTDKNGETFFKWNNYIFGKNNSELNKYCNDPDYGLNGFTDNLTQLLPEDDAAYQTKKFYNYKFHIPTKEQCEELINYTQNYWVKNYNSNKTIYNSKGDGVIHGLNGRVFKGKNGNQMFIPAAGCCGDSDIYYAGSNCRLWSSTLYLGDPNFAYSLNFSLAYIYTERDGRCIGHPIRPVINL